MQMLSKKTLRVIANPFAAPLSADGMPIAAFQYDPEHSPGVVMHVGATIERTLVLRRPDLSAQQNRYAKRFVFDLSPQPVVDSHYHREAVRRGELLAADTATARICSTPTVKVKVDPAGLLAKARDAAIKAWEAQHPDEDKIDQAAWLKFEAAVEPVEATDDVPALDGRLATKPILANWPGGGGAAPRAPAPSPKTTPSTFPAGGGDK